MEDYYRELKEWNDYWLWYCNNVLPLEEELKDLENKRINAFNIYDSKKVYSYAAKELDKCENIIDVMQAMHVPEIVKECHDGLIASRILSKQWHEYMHKSLLDIEAGIASFDEAKAQALANKRDRFVVQADQKAERITKNFNQRAKELGLEIPYPEFE